MISCQVTSSWVMRRAVALLAVALFSGLPTSAPAQERLAILTCEDMSGHQSDNAIDRDGAVRRAVARHDWDEVRTLISIGRALPTGLVGRNRLLAMRAFRSVELVFASARGDLPRVNMLLAQGADPNVELRMDSYATPLAWAARCNHRSVVQRLLRAGARVNYRFGYSDTQAVHEGGTALIWASEAGSVDIVRLLLSRGARADLQESFYEAGRPPRVSGVTALDVAANRTIEGLLRSRLRRPQPATGRR